MLLRSLLLPLFLALFVTLLAVPIAAGEAGTYVVAKGDALETIAERFGTTVDALVRLNNLRNPDRLTAGQSLRVPEQPSPVRPAVAQPPTPSPLADALFDIYGIPVDYPFLPSSFTTHVVAPGESFAVIAGVYGLPVEDLMAANPTAEPRSLQIGQRLNVPTRSGSARGGDRGTPTRTYLFVPYRTQYDGTYYADSNCGPATLGMQMSYYDEWWSSHGIRRDVNAYTGDYTKDGGSDWESLARAARKRRFSVVGLYDGAGNYRRWTIDDLVAEVRGGNPPILLVRYKNLPGHAGSSWWGDHYIVFLGTTASGDIVYHDSAFNGEDGAYLTMSEKQFMLAWSTNAAGIQYSAMGLRWPN